MSIVIPGLTHCEEHMNPIGLGYVCEECEEKRKLKDIDADKMFEELGYEKDEDEISVYYKYKKFGNMIVLNLRSKEIHFHSDGIDTIGSITLQELKAINKKVEELRLGGIVWMI